MPFLLALIFFVSGAAGLVYEVAWVRMLAASLGASSYTIGTVLAAYMGGLALGARWIGKRADRDSRPLRTYAKLELGIAVAAILVSFAFAAMPALNRMAYGALEGKLWALVAVRCGLAFAVLIVPTALMGATFPAMASAAASEGNKGWRVGLVYGANTLGAVAGVFLAGFWLIGNYGLRTTTWVAAGANLAAAAAAFAISSAMKPRTMALEGDRGVSEEEAPRSEQRLALATAAVAGFVSLGFEVLWTRMFSVLFASITYSFAMMLAVFLLGLALGAPIAGRISDAVKRSRIELAGVLQLAVGVIALASYLVFPHLSTQTGTTSLAFGGPSWGTYLRSLAADAASVMLLPAFVMGAILPVVARILAQGPANGMASRLGRVYAANTVGAMLGSLVTGFVLIPAIHNFAYVAVLLAVVSTGAGALLLFRGGNWQPMNRWLVTGVAAIALAFTVFVVNPSHGNVLLEKVGLLKTGLNLLHVEEGPSLTVAVVEDEATHDRTMYTDAFKVAGTGDTYEYMRMIGHLPMLLHPEAKSACVVGLGTGTTAGALSLWPLERLDIIELCPEVARATPYFGRANRGLMERIPKDPRLRLVFDDGKAYLRSTRRTYDIIVAEPLNPHMTGASSLYSKEFYEAARARLQPNGIVTQWIPIHGVKPEDFRSLFHTFAQVFPETAVWYFKEAILLTGTNGKFGIRFPSFKAALDLPQTQAELIPLGLEEVYTLLACFVCGPKAVGNYGRYAPVITDDLPTIEYFHPGQPVAFAEHENLDGLAQHREKLLPYVTFDGLAPGVAKWQASYFTVVSTNHFIARGMYIEARKLEMEADRARQTDMNAAKSLYGQALEKLHAAANAAPEDRYIKRHLMRYEKNPTGAVKLTPELAGQIVAMAKGASAEKVSACQKLDQIADWQAAEVIRPLLTDSDSQVRYAAVKALGPMGYNEATTRRDKVESDIAELLKQVLERNARETREVLLQTIDSLKTIGPKGASSLLAAFPLKGPHGQAGCDDPEVRVAAVVALREIDTDESLGYLFLVLDDPDRNVRGEAVTSLANAAYPWVVPALLQALADPIVPIRKVAAEGMKRITKVGLQWKEDAPPEIRGAAALEWERWYDSWRKQRDWSMECGRMEYPKLSSKIDELMAARPEPQRAAWNRLHSLLETFLDEKATPTPTADMLSKPIDEFLPLVYDDMNIWMAVVILEIKAGPLRGVMPPDRMKSKR